ncbi:P-type conjugative transfer protein TrbJ [Hyphococcus sp.]|uniref:P-type conjugative transfer protein TrbJ n=1 Tax=Hyphococcus sp. TaxID=2038636 RepID=UPI0035C6D0C3
MLRRMKSALMAGIASMGLALAPIQPAGAVIGFGGVVYDPSNHAENLLTAARTLQMINNQVEQLANDARMIANQAKNLTQLPYSARAALRSRLSEIDMLIRTAHAIAYDVDMVDAAFASLFPEDYASFSNAAMGLAARAHWEEASRSLHDAMRVQAKIAETVRLDMTTLNELVFASETAVGDLQASQAGNQLLALQTKQSMHTAQLLAVQHRAEALERARQLQSEERSRIHRRRFLGDGDAYTSS